MKVFFDSSAFAKRFIEESGSQHVEELCVQATELYLSVLCVPEIVSALQRRLREKSLTPYEYAQAKSHLAQDVRDAIIVNLTESVLQASITVLESSPVRILDALHIGCAIECGVELFVSADAKQLVAARRVGLKTRPV